MPSRFVKYVQAREDLSSTIQRLVFAETVMVVSGAVFLFCVGVVGLHLIALANSPSWWAVAGVVVVVLVFCGAYRARSRLAARFEREIERHAESVVEMACGGGD